MHRDAYYTPQVLANDLLSHVSFNDKWTSVIDFCMGDGELLRAAESKWNRLEVFGVDICRKTIDSAQFFQSKWNLLTADFLNEEEMCISEFSHKKQNFDLILLNPPFSCSGSQKFKSIIKGIEFQTSTSMKFLLESTKYLSEKGAIYAIMPLSVAYSEKDKEAWNFLVKNYNLRVLEEKNNKNFKGCSPNIILLSLNDFSKKKYKNKEIKCNTKLDVIDIFRGKLSVHRVPIFSGNIPFIHTTNLKENSLYNITKYVKYNSSVTEGPAILLPRVGKPDINKLCLLEKDIPVCISDCIISLKFSNSANANSAFSILKDHWLEFSQLYKGTGAHYITVDRLNKYLGIDNI